MDQVIVVIFHFDHRIRVCFDLGLSPDHLAPAGLSFESLPPVDRSLDYLYVAAGLSSDHCLRLAGLAEDRLNFQSLGCLASTEQYRWERRSHEVMMAVWRTLEQH